MTTTDKQRGTGSKPGEERATETSTAGEEHTGIEDVVAGEVVDHALDVAEVVVGIGFAEPDGVAYEDGAVAEVDTEAEGEAAESGQDCDYYDGGREFMVHSHPQILGNTSRLLSRSISPQSRCLLNGGLAP